MTSARPATLPPMLRAFLERVAGEPSTLALDYDGTLAPFRAHRDEALPPPEVIDPLRAIAREPATRLVIISGRPVTELAALLRIEPRPELWGAHGWEHLDPHAAASTTHAPSAEVTRVLARAEHALRVTLDAAHVERKIASLAVHWRGLDRNKADETEHLARTAFAEARCEDLDLRAFDGGLELRARGHDKGEVTRTLLARWSGAPPLLYAGDDDTDEDAFAALRGVAHGLGVRVGVARTTHAALTLDARALPGLLAAWLAATRRAVRPSPASS